jgi:hypothetical protein
VEDKEELLDMVEPAVERVDIELLFQEELQL